jgi:hypothetical protein
MSGLKVVSQKRVSYGGAEGMDELGVAGFSLPQTRGKNIIDVISLIKPLSSLPPLPSKIIIYNLPTFVPPDKICNSPASPKHDSPSLDQWHESLPFPQTKESNPKKIEWINQRRLINKRLAHEKSNAHFLFPQTR